MPGGGPEAPQAVRYYEVASGPAMFANLKLGDYTVTGSSGSNRDLKGDAIQRDDYIELRRQL